MPTIQELFDLTGRVAVVPGESFGAEGYVRLSYAMDEQRIDSGLQRIREFMEALQ